VLLQSIGNPNAWLKISKDGTRLSAGHGGKHSHFIVTRYTDDSYSIRYAYQSQYFQYAYVGFTADGVQKPPCVTLDDASARFNVVPGRVNFPPKVVHAAPLQQYAPQAYAPQAYAPQAYAPQAYAPPAYVAPHTPPPPYNPNYPH
jgi:hypothetical protein